jgi:alpha-tubulin suppressor-like RCC1 family protein
MGLRHFVLAAALFALAGAAALSAGRETNAAGTGPSMAAVTAGDEHTCGLTTAGRVWCWGDNASGQLGIANMAASAVPKQIASLSSITAVRNGGQHSCAISSVGGLKCWGRNQYGKLGNGSAAGINSAVPVNVTGLSSGVAAVAPGIDHTCALTTGGGVKCWGDDGSGQLGNGAGGSSNVPVDVTGLTSGVAAVASGGWHSCAVTTGGAVKCWGYGVYGQLGNGGNSGSPTPVDVTGLGSGVAAVAAGEYHTCALTTGGGIKCWGINTVGQLGDGTQDQSEVPVDVSGLPSGVSAIDGGGSFTCALTTGGGVKCWGNDTSGQLGNGAAGASLTPVDVSGLTSGVVSFATGYEHACAVTTSNVAKCWGGNADGQLGVGTNDPSNVPINITFDDVDGDGCTDAQENQTAAGSENSGGRRDRKSFWDFFDVPTGNSLARDRSISALDIFAVAARFNTAGSPAIDPLSAPLASGYHTAYDRGPSVGPNTWNLGPPNGSIAASDIFAVMGQFNHNCA